MKHLCGGTCSISITTTMRYTTRVRSGLGTRFLPIATPTVLVIWNQTEVLDTRLRLVDSLPFAAAWFDSDVFHFNKDTT
ncbi:hypothetical protein CKO18_13955 [Rhodoferax fermentans]|uniref:Uncharacterized protein n=1 Tax=Rhodoferax fermentans TaxID=28066 RepID=A0A1T1AQZ4_RHOFE|nr:hypothetical protein [Rhodoferax fermentans]OOV06514.1 hypothetical protein RF819_07010 [Rhodoferax fermentans]